MANLAVRSSVDVILKWEISATATDEVRTLKGVKDRSYITGSLVPDSSSDVMI